MISATWRLPIARITRTRRGWLPIAGWFVVAVIAAGAERARATSHAADHALLGTFGGIALPLIAYAVVGAALAGDGLARSTRALVAFGASPSRVALHAIAVAAAASAILGAILAIVVASIAHGASDPPLARDLFTSAWIAALGGAAYACLFAFGASLGQRGAGRSVLLAVDWVLGFGSGFGAIITPRAHVRSLLGGAGVIDMPQRASALCLIALAALFVALAVRRAVPLGASTSRSSVAT